MEICKIEGNQSLKVVIVLIKTSRTNLIKGEEWLRLGDNRFQVQVVEEIRDMLEAFNKNVDSSSDDESEESIINDGVDDHDCSSSESKNEEWFVDKQGGMVIDDRNNMEGNGSAVKEDKVIFSGDKVMEKEDT